MTVRSEPHELPLMPRISEHPRLEAPRQLVEPLKNSHSDASVLSPSCVSAVVSFLPFAAVTFSLTQQYVAVIALCLKGIVLWHAPCKTYCIPFAMTA